MRPELKKIQFVLGQLLELMSFISTILFRTIFLDPFQKVVKKVVKNCAEGNPLKFFMVFCFVSLRLRFKKN